MYILRAYIDIDYMSFQIHVYKYSVCQRDPTLGARWLTVGSRTSKVDTDEITFSVDHVSDGTLRQRLPTSGRQEKYCAALSQIACYAEFTLQPGSSEWAASPAIPPSLYDGIRSRSSKTWNIARPSPSSGPPRIHFARPNMFCPLFHPRNCSTDVFHELANRAAGVTYLAHLKFARFSKIRERKREKDGGREICKGWKSIPQLLVSFCLSIWIRVVSFSLRRLSLNRVYKY